VISDGSTDETNRVVKEFESPVRLIELPYNLGNGAAIKTGVRRALGEILICMDADGQHRPEDVERFLKDCERFDMVVGARSKGSQAGIHRSVANSVYNLFASYVTGRRIEDLTSGFRAMKTNVAKRFVGLLPNGFSYPTTITLSMMRSGYSVKYIPIDTEQRVGKSKIRIFSDGPKFLLVIMKICMLFSPLKIFLPVSSFLFLMGISYYGYTFFAEHRFTNMSMLLFSTSMIVFMMGLIAEQGAQIRSERAEQDV
jgi:glycosyltransferase involved in cell wall biosynthesis